MVELSAGDQLAGAKRRGVLQGAGPAHPAGHGKDLAKSLGEAQGEGGLQSHGGGSAVVLRDETALSGDEGEEVRMAAEAVGAFGCFVIARSYEL